MGGKEPYPAGELYGELYEGTRFTPSFDNIRTG